MPTLAEVARGVRIFAMLTKIPPGQSTTIPRKLLEGVQVPGKVDQTPEQIIDFFSSKLKFIHNITYSDKEQKWTFRRWDEVHDGEALQ